ncbi:hypothetical protein QYF36_014974 [Acer negundo]|nr:hypothetical protein QYF36_014974 [Acer negundo]
MKNINKYRLWFNLNFGLLGFGLSHLLSLVLIFEIQSRWRRARSKDQENFGDEEAKISSDEDEALCAEVAR